MSAPATPVRVLVIDDQPAFIQAVEAVVAETAGFVMAGACLPNGPQSRGDREVLVAVERTHPDLLLVDVRMPGVDGAELAMHVRAACPHLAVVLVSAFAREDVPSEALNAGIPFLAKEKLTPEALASCWARPPSGPAGGGCAGFA